MKVKAKIIRSKPETLYLKIEEKLKFYNLPWLGVKMTKKIQKQNNAISITILQIFIMGIGICLIPWTQFYSLLIAFIIVLLTGFLYTYDYTCVNCGSTTGKDSEVCRSCKKVFK